MAFVGDESWMNGPIVLSPHSAKVWKSQRARAAKMLKAHHAPSTVLCPAVVVDLEGEMLVLPRNYPTAWQARPWGGFLLRMVQLEKMFGHEEAARWNPDGLDGWKTVLPRLKIAGPSTLTDFSFEYDELEGAPLEVKLAKGEYAVDVIESVRAGKDTLQILRLRNVPFESLAVAAPAKKAAATPMIAKEARALAKKLSLAQSEGGPMLLISGDDLASWRGIESDDYERAGAAETKVLRVGKSSGIVLGSPDPSGFLLVNGEIWIVRQLGSDGPLATVGGALTAGKWKKTRLSIRVGKSRALYLIDSAADGKALAKRKRLPGRVEVASGEYVLENAGELKGELLDGKKTLSYLLELHRLRKR